MTDILDPDAGISPEEGARAASAPWGRGRPAGTAPGRGAAAVGGSTRAPRERAGVTSIHSTGPAGPGPA